MKGANRDLLVLSRKASPDPIELEHEVEQLHEILFHVECIYNFCMATEIVDINRAKIITRFSKMERIVRKGLKPFQFIHNKN